MSVEARTQLRTAPIVVPTVHSDLVRRQIRLSYWLLLPSLLVVALVALVLVWVVRTEVDVAVETEDEDELVVR